MRVFKSLVSSLFYYIGIILVVLGFLVGLLISFKVGKIYKTLSGESGLGIGISIFLTTFLGSAFSGACLIAVSEVLEALETSCSNIVKMNDNIESILTKISSNNNKNTEKNYGNPSNNNSLPIQSKNEPKSGWICMSCGSRNDMNAEYCSCGKPKNKAITFGK
jgi:ribosomal protein L40E